MSGDINYVEWFDRVDARKREIEQELEMIKPLLATLAPLAGRGDPTQIIMDGMPVPQKRVEVVDAGGAAVEETDGEAGVDEEDATPQEPGVYTYMNSQEAALHFMRKVGGRRGTLEIADALRAGGFRTKSPHFINNVYTTMRRLGERGLVERVGAGIWQLTEAGQDSEVLESETAEGVGAPTAVSEDRFGDQPFGSDGPRLELNP